MNHPYEPLVKTLELIASVPRLVILRFVLENQWTTVTEISEGTRIKNNNVSQHLQRLVGGKLLIVIQDGVYSRYAMNRQAVETALAEALQHLRINNASQETTVSQGEGGIVGKEAEDDAANRGPHGEGDLPGPNPNG